MKTLKDFLKFKSGKVLDLKYPIQLFDEKGNKIYHENSNGYWYKQEYNANNKQIYFENFDGLWSKREYDESGKLTYSEKSDGFYSKWEFDETGNEIYFENSNGFWSKREYDENNNEIYHENSDGWINDRRPAEEMTVDDIEKAKESTINDPLEHVVKWINPDDELPPLGELVLVRIMSGNIVSFDNICDTGGWLHNSYIDDPKKHDVKYWMRIPEKPQDV